LKAYRPVLSSRTNSAISLSNCCCIAAPPPCAMAGNWTDRDLGWVKNGQVYAERLARLRSTGPKQ
jgi:hypothetical protein